MEVKDMSWVVGKIGFCLDKYLGITRVDNKESTGHFVYIHSIDKNNKCTVSTFISMYNEDGSVKANQIYNGHTLPIPKYASSFNGFTGLQKQKIKNIDVRKIVSIGRWYISDGYIKAYKTW
jgi:hypothetical protein